MSDSGSLFAVMSDSCPLAAYAGPLLLRDEPPAGCLDFLKGLIAEIYEKGMLLRDANSHRYFVRQEGPHRSSRSAMNAKE